MKTLLSLFSWDCRMQYRYGFWLAGLVVTVVWAALLYPLPADLQRTWLPCVLYFDVATMGMMFVAGLLFFERKQGVIDALVATPLPTPTWLLSKLLSLTLLATVVACALVLLTIGWRAAWLRLVPAFALSAALFTLLGFLAAARYGNVTGFLTFFAIVGLPLALPVAYYFGVLRHPLLWLNPAQPTVVLIRQAFRPGAASPAELWASVLLAAGWTLLGLWLSARHFHRHVSWRRGAR